ncbi:hypothetical protein [Qipengyuania sp. 902]|uniref:hypothetical protein n=1 Tax=Qipengyuania sp. 902 TaxID=3417565 RepID=UPI003EBB6F1C
MRAQPTIESRLRRLEQKLNDELGFRDQRLRFAKTASRNGPITWALRNHSNEACGLILPQGSAAELAPATNDESILYFGYNEQWQPARGRGQIEFASSNLRFVISGVEAIPDLQFRLEWAGAKTEGGVIGYPGQGAAHPHWQFDVDAGWLDTSPSAADGDEPIEIDLEPKAKGEEIDLDDSNLSADATQKPRISATLAGFRHLHLPARTMWHDLLCVMPDVAAPQQHTPTCHDEIDRWVISALRYLRSEFQTYT